MNIVEFKPEHLFQMDVQNGQAHLAPYITPEYATALDIPGHAYTGIHDGQVVFSAGMIDVWQGRAMVWAYLSESAGKHFIGIHKAVKRFLEMHNDPRIETTVDIGFEQGHRWVKMLGFELEAPCMRKYFPSGIDAALYARVRTSCAS